MEDVYGSVLRTYCLFKYRQGWRHPLIFVGDGYDMGSSLECVLGGSHRSPVSRMKRVKLDKGRMAKLLIRRHVASRDPDKMHANWVDSSTAGVYRSKLGCDTRGSKTARTFFTRLGAGFLRCLLHEFPSRVVL